MYSLVRFVTFVSILSQSVGTLVVTDVLKRYVELPNKCIWKYSENITVESPFIFFHQRKAGGTSLRTTLRDTAYLLRWSDCIAGTKYCGHAVFGIPQNKSAKMYLGHFNWQASLHAIPEAVLADDWSDRCPIEGLSCMTNFREPISRVESCIYERFAPIFEKFQGRCINDIPLDHFARELIDFRLPHGNAKIGCLNEPFRIFATNDEDVLSSVGFSVNIDSRTVSPRFDDRDLAVMNLAVNTMAHCVPYVLELPDSMKLLKRNFPRLYKRHGFNESVVKNQRVGGSNCSRMDQGHLAVVTNMTRLEASLYQVVRDKVQSAMAEFGV